MLIPANPAPIVVAWRLAPADTTQQAALFLDASVRAGLNILVAGQ